jgi:hypothetical protein
MARWQQALSFINDINELSHQSYMLFTCRSAFHV